MGVGIIVALVVVLFGINLILKGDGVKGLFYEQTATVIPVDKQIVLDTKIFAGSEKNFVAIINDILTKNTTKNGDILHLRFLALENADPMVYMDNEVTGT